MRDQTITEHKNTDRHAWLEQDSNSSSVASVSIVRHPLNQLQPALTVVFLLQIEFSGRISQI
jgi:hypothetical protein